ncbi:cupin domain-containing protein [Streptomyces deserti]
MTVRAANGPGHGRRSENAPPGSGAGLFPGGQGRSPLALAVLLHGSVRVVPQDGDPVRLGAGDVAVLAGGARRTSSRTIRPPSRRW